MIDTDKYEGHTAGPWTDVSVLLNAGSKCPVCYGDYFKTGENENDIVIEIQEKGDPDVWLCWTDPIAVVLPKGGIPHPEFDAETVEQVPNMKLIADAPLLFEEVKRLRSLAENLYDFYVGTYDGSLHLFEQQMDWREEE